MPRPGRRRRCFTSTRGNFDVEQEQLPLSALSGLRTYHGISASRGRLDSLMSEGRSFVRAIEVVHDVHSSADSLPRFGVATGPERS